MDIDEYSKRKGPYATRYWNTTNYPVMFCTTDTKIQGLIKSSGLTPGDWCSEPSLPTS